ncbi:MAG: hypothetical protein ICV64_05300 [Thermoleophilia bacterium]|nr:hypothetical protein [Thermoleophilia bacterium]
MAPALIPLRYTRRAVVAAALVSLTAAIAVWSNRHYSGDVYWLLAAGREIAANGLPQRDPFPTLSEGREWHNQQWLAELVLYGLHAAGGMLLLSLAYALVLGASALPLLLGSRRRRPLEVLAVWAFLVPLLIAVMDPRAAGFSLLCFALLVVLVDGERRRWRVWLIPPLFVLWANLHGGFLVGLLFFALVVAGGALDARLGRRADPFGRRFVLLGLALPAMLVTPLSFAIFDYLGALSSNPLLPRLTYEWDPTPVHPELLLVVALFAGFAGYLWWRSAPPRPLEPLLVAGAFVVLALTAARQLVWLGPVAFYLLRRLGRPGEIAVTRRLSLPALGVGLALLLAWALWWGPPPPEAKLMAPLAERVAAGRVEGRVAAPTGTGSYLLWRAPGQRITVDGRYEQYRPAELEAALDLLAGQHVRLLDEWNVAAVVTPNPAGAARLTRAGLRVRAHDGDGYLLSRDR